MCTGKPGRESGGTRRATPGGDGLDAAYSAEEKEPFKAEAQSWKYSARKRCRELYKACQGCMFRTGATTTVGKANVS